MLSYFVGERIRFSLSVPPSMFLVSAYLNLRSERSRATLILLVGAGFLLAGCVASQARNLTGAPSGSTASGSGGASSAVSTSQSTTAATAAAAQAQQAAVLAARAQQSLVKSTTAFQNIAAAQAAARQAALNSSLNSISSTDGTQTDGLAPGLLEPVGGVPSQTTAGIQIVKLGGSGQNQLSLGNGGTVALPKGTTGSDAVTISGAGSITSPGGTVTATAGSVTTTTGGTLTTSNGGTISLTGGSGILTSSAATTISSTLAGTITLPQNGGTLTLSANQSVTIPAGSSVTFTGSGTGTVTVAGSGSVSLAGAGTLSIANAAAGIGGTIVTNGGSTSFTNGAVSSLSAGSTIDFAGSGTLTFQGSGTDKLPVIIEPNVASSSSGGSTSTLTTPAFTTSGLVLNTTGYALPSSWTGIEALSQSQAANGTGKDIVTVTQDQSQALLYWDSFNIGKNTVLDFDQSAGGVNVGDWVAINRILDPSLAPSEILGAINAPGQVYVINQNGIIFTGSAQVDTHALVASTLPINSNLVTDGLLNNPNGQFLFTSDAIGGTTPYDPNNDVNSNGQSNTLPNATSGNITVEEGATLVSPGSSEGVGGKIALIAPNVTNEGELSSPDGQVILAAGNQVGFVAHPSSDPSLRGLDVAVGEVDGDPGVTDGVATNGQTGFIFAPEADVTMTGAAVEQMGTIESLTSVALNGRIDLLATYNLAPDSENLNIFDSAPGGASIGGVIDLGPSSLTEILPDYLSTDTQVGTSLALPSQFYAEGDSFHMETDAQVIAPSATATLSIGILNTPIVTGSSMASTAGETTIPVPENTGASTLNDQPEVGPVYLPSSSQTGVTLDSGANLDVSGSSDVQASVAENIISAELTEAVLENSPLQEDGPLRGATVQVDVSQTGVNADGSIWYGSPIGDLSGYANLVEHTVGELTIAGGSVSINTSGPVTLNSGSTVNVSGGSIDYQGAMVQTTKVITADGQVLDISQATPDQVYQGLDNGFTVNSSKWGVSQSYSNSLESDTYYDAGYVEGGSGGSLAINTPSASLSGSLFGNTTIGTRQQLRPPVASSFNLDIQSSTGVNPPLVNIVIQPDSDAQSDPDAVYLSPDLFGIDGFSKAAVDTGSGTITVSSDSVISAASDGSINFTAANVNIDGQIYVPSGSVTVTGLAQDPLDATQGNATSYNPAIGNVELGADSVIATTGLTFDEMSGTTPGTLPFGVNGGSVSISGAVTTMMTGSLVDASGGVARSSAGKIYDGKGGSISLSGIYTDLGAINGELVLDGTLSAYGVGTGGILKLTAPAVQVGSGAAQSSVSGVNTLVLSDGFFSQGGFSNFSVTGTAGTEITAGTIAPVLTEEVANASGQQLEVYRVSSSQLPQYPAAPVNLAFSAPGAKGGAVATLALDSGASILAGATSTVSLTGQLVDILGDVFAPGGTINVTGDSTEELIGQSNFGAPDVSVYLGPGATLSTSGVEITAPTQIDYQTYNTGEVLAGGTINITGNIVSDPTSSLQADGTEGSLDVPFTETGLDLSVGAFARSENPYVSEVIASNGGTIKLNGIEELYFSGSVSAKAGGQTAIGGTLTVGSGIVAVSPGATYPESGFPELFVSQDGISSPGTVVLGQSLSAVPATGGGYFSVNQFNAGGFGSLILDGNVEFVKGAGSAPFDITASQEIEIVPDSLDGTVFADGSDETVNITAPYIEIGSPTLTFGTVEDTAFAPTYVSINVNGTATQASPIPGIADPTYGSATLNLTATSLIDVEFLSLQNIGTTNFSVPTGDIRGGGLFYAAGDINLTAGQIYTPTAATFTIAAFDAYSSMGAFIEPGTVDIEPGVSRPLPLSAGGTINVYGTDITQNGVIEAPFGVINMGASTDSSSGLAPVLADVDITFDSNTQTYIRTPDYTQYAPVTQQLTLGANSVTSVSGVSSTGQALDLPYGTIENGTEWIAPNGADITAGGLPAKAVNLNGATINDVSGAVVDLAGGGDLFAYQFSSGVGGTNDILSIDKYSGGNVVTTEVSGVSESVLSDSFAIVPDYGSNGVDYAPVDLTMDSTGALPYANSALTSEVGDEIYLAGGDGLPAGTYTILPARYALLPGAYLISPTRGTTPTNTAVNPDGSVEMAGYIYNSLKPGQQIVPNVGGYEVDSSAVIDSRAEYDIDSADTFLAASAVANNQPVPRLPMDAGQLVFFASQSLDLQEGAIVDGSAAAGGLGSQVDIASSDNIEINNSGVDASFNGLVLDSTDLSSIDASSLLVGGYRKNTSSGTTVMVTTGDLVVDNTGSTLQAGDVILASNGTLSVAGGSTIASTGSASAENLAIVNGSTGNSDGALLRVSGDTSATINRGSGVNLADTNPSISIADGATIEGNSMILDSTGEASLGANVQFSGVNAISIDAGRISIELDNGETLQPNPGLALSAATIEAFQTSAQSLALASYSSIDFYGSGTIGGGIDSSGVYPVGSLTLDAGAIRGLTTTNPGGVNAGGGSVNINAEHVTLDNAINGVSPGAVAGVSPDGSLTINAGTIQLGSNALMIDGYSNTTLSADEDIAAGGTGSVTTQGALNLATPLVTATAAAHYSINAGGVLDLTQPSSPGTSQVSGGLGATISLTGSDVILASEISAPSGTINVQATSGNVEMQSGGVLDAIGQSVLFGNVTDYTSGGQVNLNSTNGGVTLAAGSLVNVSAQSGGGNAGTVSVLAPNGTLSLANGTLEGVAANGTAGTFNVEVGQAPLLSALTTPVEAGGFQVLAFDVKSGSVTVDGAVGGSVGQNGLTSFSLTTEQGSITVDNTINASGPTGGTIDLYADQDVTLTGHAVLTVEGRQFNSAGQGGVVDIETRGNGTEGIDIQSGAQINLKVDYLPVVLSQASSSQTASSVTLAAADSFVLPDGTPGNDQLQFSSGGVMTAPDGSTETFAANQVLSNVVAGSKVTLGNPGSVTFVAGGTGGAVPIWLPSAASFTSVGASNSLGMAALTAAQAGDSGGTLHLRAPTTSNGTDLEINSGALANADILGDPTVILEGYNVYNAALTSTAGQSTSAGAGQIDAGLEGGPTDNVAGTIYGDAVTFAANTEAILTRLLGGTAPTAAQVAEYQVTPGAEVINATPSTGVGSVNGGSLTLASNWDLSSFRFGPDGVAGILTLRATNNLIFNGSLSDGFAYNSSDAENVPTSPYTWDVMAESSSWSYRLVAGAEFTSGGSSTANYGSVQSLAALGLDTDSLTNASDEAGSLLLGQSIPSNFNYGTLTATTASKYAQLIRTGSGSITIDTGGSLDLLNGLASIYTAGYLAPSLAGFNSPTGTSDSKFETKVYGVSIAPAPQYTAQYTEGGGNIVIDAQQDIAHLRVSGGSLVPDTSWEFPTSWLYRRGATSSTDIFDTTKLNANELATTTWWINFSNFFEGVGALGGGNVTLKAGGNIVNVDAVVPTNARMPFADASGNSLPDAASSLVELGGGNLVVEAGGTIEGGTYYVEQGTGEIIANTITSADDTARISADDAATGSATPLPLTLFVGDSSFTVETTNDLTIGSTVNPFWLPQGIGNGFDDESVFSTYGPDSAVNLSSLLGTITVQGSESSGVVLPGSLYDAYYSNASPGGLKTTRTSVTSLNKTPWTLTLDPTPAGTNFIDNVTDYSTFYAVSPPIFRATAFSGNIQYDSDQILMPSSQGTLQLLAAGSVDGAFDSTVLGNGVTASITILDDDPSQLPSIVNPFGLGESTVDPVNNPSIGAYITDAFALMGETPSYANQSFTTLESYHTPGLLHDDPDALPVEIDTINGDVGDFTLISPEKVDISSGLDLQDVSFYIQNNNANDISVVSADRDITLFDPNSTALVDLGATQSFYVAFGDLQVSGPGTLEVLAGRNLDLGEGSSPNGVNQIGTGLGITSIGQSRNPYLPFGGASIIAAAGLGDTNDLDGGKLDFGNVTVASDGSLIYPSDYSSSFIGEFLDPQSGESAIYLPDLGTAMNLPSSDSTQQVWADFVGETKEEQDAQALTVFYDVLRDSGRDHNNPDSPNVGTYAGGYAAIAALFPSSNTYQGNISLTSREIKTTNDGDIDLLVPGGGVDVGLNNLGTQPLDQGILTVDGGDISIFANNDISLGTSRIFTLHGGNVIIWSTVGNIDAGASSKTVQSAPPTRVLIDSQSANVQTDLTGLATGGGIGVLATVVGAPPGNVDLIAPVGTVNAGDAGIRSSGNLNIAAAEVLNAGNIQAGGSTSGVSTSSAPNISAAVAGASTAGATQNAANQLAQQQQPPASGQEDVPSIISVQVISYGDSGDSADAAPVSKDTSVAEVR
jgi:filamentous hemagglutinin